MNMRDKIVKSAIEVSGFDGSHANITPTSGSDVESVVPTGTIEEVDDRKTPPVFGRLWREWVSVLTLAFCPALNVGTPFQRVI